MTQDPSDPARVTRPPFAISAVSTFGATVVIAMLAFLNILIVARVLGPTGRGQVALLTTIALFTSTLARLGVDQAIVNFAGREPRLRPALAVNAVVLSLLLGTIAAGVVGALMAFFPALGGGVAAPLKALALIAVPLLILDFYLHALLQADYRFTASNATSLLPQSTALLVSLVLVGLGRFSVASFVAAWFAGQALTTACLLLLTFRDLPSPGRPDPALARRALAFGIKTQPSLIMRTANYRLDQWILGAIAGSRELGLYSVAVAWAEALYYLPTALAVVQRPDIIRASRDEAARRAAAVFRVSLVLTVPCMAILIVAAPFLCLTIFGDEFRGSIDDLRILALGGFGIVALKLLGDAVVAQGRPLLTAPATGVAFVVTVALDVLLIPPHGGLGAAIASTLAYSAGGIALAIIFSRALGQSPRELVPKGNELQTVVQHIRRLVQRR
jgi:O-antigen/teichoic acid export membrane protein